MDIWKNKKNYKNNKSGKFLFTFMHLAGVATIMEPLEIPGDFEMVIFSKKCIIKRNIKNRKLNP